MSKKRSVPSLYRITILFLVEKLTLARQIEQHCTIVTSISIFTDICPLNRGITPNAISIFYLKKRYCGCLVFTTRVKVLSHPAMSRTTIEESRWLVTNKRCKIFFLLSISGAFWIYKKIEVHLKISYLGI